MAWRQLQIDSEAGPQQVWIDEQTGQTSTTNPALAGAGLGYTNEMRQGPDGAMVDTQLVSTIGGIPADQFITRPRADGRLETYNPKTGQWEKTYRAPFDMAGGNQFVPESIGKPIGGAFIEFNKPAENKGGFFEDYALPAIIGGIATAGVGSMLGAGSLFSGSNALSGLSEAELANAGSGLGQGIEGAAIAAGPTMNTGANMGFLEELSGLSNFDPNGPVRALLPSENVSEWQAMQNNGSWGDEISNWGGGAPAPDMSNPFFDINTPAGSAVLDNTAGSWQQQLLNMGIPLPDSLKEALSTANSGLGVLNAISGGSGGGSGSSLWDILGRAAPGLLGAYAANKQTSALTDLANKFSEYGAPSRARYEASMTPGFDPTSIPGYSGALDTASQSILRKLSATGGNPYGNPGGLIEANKQIVSGTALPAIQQYQNQNANTGGLGALAAAYPSTQQAATQSGANVYNALGSAAGNVFNPPQTASQSLADIYKMLNLNGMKAA